VSEVEDLRVECEALRRRNEQLLGVVLQHTVQAQGRAGARNHHVDANSAAQLFAAEESARTSLDLLEESQAIAHIGSWSSGPGPNDPITWSAECYRIFGVPLGTPVTVGSFFALVHPDDRSGVHHTSRDAIDRGAQYDIEHRVQRDDGEVRWVHERALVERDADGCPIRMFGTVQDVTDRHLAMEALRASDTEFRLLAEAMPQIVWVTRPDGGNVYFNQQWVDYTGLTLAESLGDGWNRPFHPDDKQRAWKAWQNATTTIGTYALECRLRRADGAYRWWLIRGVPIRDAHGHVVKWFGTCTDIEELKGAHAALAEREALLRVAGRAARLGGWLVSLPDLGVTWSDEVCAIHEVPPGTRQTMEQVLAFYAPEFRDTFRVAFDVCVREGRSFDLEVQIVTTTDRRVWVRSIGEAERDVSGTIVRVRGAFQDVDERRRLQDQFRQAQKMEAVGRLAGGVAHDFNNLLSVVLSYAELALEALTPGEPVREDIEEIRRAGQRATALTRQLLAFSRQQVLEPRVVDLSEIVAAMKPMLHRLLGEDIDLTVLAPPRVGRVLVDPGQVEQVVMNLAVNARDAMPEGGQLTIEVTNLSLSESHVGRPADVPSGPFVMLAVTDTGVGMAETTRARVFEPFFTTKEIGKGTGLGLATVLGIVQQSSGYVSVYSEPGHGTTFKVYLPRTDRIADATLSHAPSTVLDGSETILLVEDEKHVRAVACTILRRHGYHVLEASNGGEALRLSNDFSGDIDLLLTDVVMPHLSGRRLAEQLVPQRPHLKVIFTSGYTDDAIIRHGVLDAGVAFVQKPFTPQALLRKVREVLGPPNSHAPAE